MEEIKLIKDIVASPNAGTLSYKLMNAQVELNETRNFLSDATNCCTDDYDISVACKMILRKHIEYLQYKVEMLKTMHTKLQNNKYIKRDEAPELTTVPNKPEVKKEVSYSIPYTSSDIVDMLI
jgi:NurA-like 5'-3' nuclease